MFTLSSKQISPSHNFNIILYCYHHIHDVSCGDYIFVRNNVSILYNNIIGKYLNCYILFCYVILILYFEINTFYNIVVYGMSVYLPIIYYIGTPIPVRYWLYTFTLCIQCYSLNIYSIPHYSRF